MLFFDRPDTGERALIIHVIFANFSVGGHSSEDLQEFALLAESAGAEVTEVVSVCRDQPSPKYLIGSGKVEELQAKIDALSIELVLVNYAISPAQQRNLEHAFKVRVVDRTGLILDIFAQRAQTFEGKLQVELAQLQHLSTRLVRGWTHLERQKGGIGLRGPGETQLESDRRMVRGRIQSLTRRLERVRKQRDQGRRSRKKQNVLTVSLVGYTNAGKSTLFNALTGADVFAADQLFATLDPAHRVVAIPHVGDVMLTDTVGFIKHLPHKLVRAFHATLEAVCDADLLLHVIDASASDRDEIRAEVAAVLAEIGASEVPCLEVFNKVDLLAEQGFMPEPDVNATSQIRVSARTGAGIEHLQSAIGERIQPDMVQVTVLMPPSQGGTRAQLYSRKLVLKEAVTEQGDCLLDIRLPANELSRLLKHTQIQVVK